MKLTKKLEAEIKGLMDDYWDSYFRGDLKHWRNYLVDDYRNIGGTEEEIWNSKKEILDYTKLTIKQMIGQAEIRNKKTQIIPYDPYIMVHEFMDLFIKVEGKWTFYGKFRLSSLIQKIDGEWKVLHQHGSYPDSHTEQGEAFAVDKMRKENTQLREAVKRRTLELEEKNRELEIETALEKVRAIALGMKKPEDMLDVCKTISLQLQSLGVKDIRNVQTAIFYFNKGTYMNYEYYARHRKTFITETIYTDHKVAKAFAAKMRKGKGEVYITYIKGEKKVKEWLGYQKKTNVFIDKHLEKASSLNYYWHSLGPVALGISTYTPLSKDELKLFNRFLIVFELAYTRYLDIEQAIAQVKEAKIEAALEKVRAQAMAMHRPDDILNVCKIIFKELPALGFKDVRNALINFWDDASKSLIDYDYSDFAGGNVAKLAYSSHPVFEQFQNTIRGSKDAFAQLVVTKSQLASWRKRRRESGEYEDPRLNKINALYYYFYSIGVGAVGISSFKPLATENIELLKRFRNVFDLAYRRYQDIQKAEAQAREARIETALERVRAVAMAMKRSEELVSVSEVMYNELKSLGFSNIRNAQIAIENEEKESFVTYIHSDHEHSVLIGPYSSSSLLLKAKQQLSASGAFYDAEYTGKELDEWRAWRKSRGTVTHDPRELSATSLRWYLYSIGKGHMGISTFDAISAEQVEIVKRFKNVFELSYRRFDDLQKAEAQAREAQIEAALEKVRSRSLAMHSSGELGEVVTVVLNNLLELGYIIDQGAAAHLAIFSEGTKDFFQWSADPALPHPVRSFIPYTDLPILTEFWDARQKGHDFFAKVYSFDEKNTWFNYAFEHSDLKHIPEELKKLLLESETYAHSVAIEKNSAIIINSITGNQLSENQIDILRRFSKVFEQAYIRFLDLQKAEAQAREAKIEAALERTRTQSMLMQHSEELKDVSKIFHQQLLDLNIETEFSYLWLPDEPNGKHLFWATWAEKENDKIIYFSKAINYDLDKTEPATAMCFSDWESGVPVHVYTLGPAETVAYFETWKELLSGAKKLRPEFFPKGIYYAESFMKYGCFGIMIHRKITAEEQEILRRFTVEFERTYTRFLDLKKVEAQSREAQIEIGVERVRSRTLAMHKSDELAETAAVVFKQLINLDIEPSRLYSLYIGIFKDESGEIEAWPTDETGSKPTQKFILNIHRDVSVKKIYEAWHEKKRSIIIDIQGKELDNYLRYLQDELGIPFAQSLSQKRRIQYIAYFDKGFIGMASPDEQPKETLQLLERFATVFNLTYTRFNDLQQAEKLAQQAEQDLVKLKEEKKKTEDALTELKATQTQLIQSEKMASLGELTAGIAHEIQNPLNFVNNFSEVSNELLDEMVEEVRKGNYADIEALVNDVKQNLEKINHHGKRADGIVKGMLQHSRSSSGVKEPTDINALADEYLRLAYHGLRAKDKSFNANMKTDYDKSIGNINIIPQDIGRVILNLITNAFYVVNEKKIQQPKGYEPTVSVRTKKINDKVEISVGDNGNGIPAKVLDKIFQPFFTTKPTGQGTGLGLSLSYDIVKAHGGELKVKTKENEGTEFSIILPV